jgi:hypothetical protein
MNLITATYNISTQEFDFVREEEFIYPGITELRFAFVSSQEITIFQNLNFGYSIVQEGKGAIKAERFPEVGVKYEQADNSPLHSTKFELEKQTTYGLQVWVENNGIITDANHDIAVDKPKKPYDSWSWNGNTWVAPIPAPEDCDRTWDEKNKKWVIKS